MMKTGIPILGNPYIIYFKAIFTGLFRVSDPPLQPTAAVQVQEPANAFTLPMVHFKMGKSLGLGAFFSTESFSMRERIFQTKHSHP